VLFSVDDADPTDNDVVALVLWEDGNESAPDEYWYFPRALVTGYDQSHDTDNKEPVEWTANFGADGRFFKPLESRSDDYATPTTSTLEARLEAADPYRALS
jgi:hypothetical protein